MAAARRGDRSRKRRERETAEPDAGIQGVPLEPIRVVERELTRPDGSTLRVKVPVYPPFRLPDRSEAPPAAKARPTPAGRRKKAS